MPARALSFGSAVAAYERYRPGYPDELAAAVFRYADRPVGTALEFGAGTGKATRLFAAHGVAVTATEPDAAMLAELRRQVPASVVTRRCAFEDLPVGPDAERFDLVYAAAALHWTVREGRWSRMAALLKPGGTFGAFGGSLDLADAELDGVVRTARAPWIADDDVPVPVGPEPWPGSELRTAPGFTDAHHVTIERRWSMPAADYLGYLSTVSAYLTLDEAARAATFAAIAAVLPESVAVTADLELDLARRS